MHVEIVQGASQPESRTITTKDGGQRQVHDQQAFLHTPGAPYPLPFKIPLETAASAYAPGTYIFSADSVRTNNYGNLEFNRFGMKLLKAEVKPAQLKQAS